VAGSARALPPSLVLAGLLAGLLTGCGPGPDGGAPPAPAAGDVPPTSDPTTAAPPDATASAAEPSADAVRAAGVPVTVGGRTVLHAAPAGAADAGVAAGSPEDGDVVEVTVTAATGGPVEVLLAAPAGGTVSLQDDGSLLTLGPDGGFLGGAARPVTVPAGGPVTVAGAGDGVVRVSARDGALRLRVASRALAATDWGEREGGRSLAVTPTPWARTAGQAGEVGVWTELVAAVPEADTAVMRDQLTCHAFGAPDKETWNLEPWRPDVGLFGVLAAACNPT
jgi:Protein of unknown function (DUF2599)